MKYKVTIHFEDGNKSSWHMPEECVPGVMLTDGWWTIPGMNRYFVFLRADQAISIELAPCEEES